MFLLSIFQLFRMYVRKASELFGITRTREIYEKAIEMLPDSDAAAICLQYAQLEVKLGEIDRARAIYSYAAQMCDPRVCHVLFINYFVYVCWGIYKYIH